MAAVQLVNGWLVIPYKGNDLATVQFKIDGEIFDAYLDFVGGQRVAKIRPPAEWDRSKPVELWINGVNHG